MIVATFLDDSIAEFSMDVLKGKRYVLIGIRGNSSLPLVFESGDEILVERITKRRSVFMKVQVYGVSASSNFDMVNLAGIMMGFRRMR